MYDSWFYVHSSIRWPHRESPLHLIDNIVGCFARAFVPTQETLPYRFRSMTTVHGVDENLDRYDQKVARAKVQSSSLAELLVKFTIPVRNPYIISHEVIERKGVFCTIRQTVDRANHIEVKLSFSDVDEWFDPYPVPLQEEYSFVQNYIKQGFILQKGNDAYTNTEYIGDGRLTQVNRQKVFEALHHYIRLFQLDWFVATYESCLAFDERENPLFFKTHNELEEQWLSGPEIYFSSPSIEFGEITHLRHPNTYFTIDIDDLCFYLNEETFGFVRK